MSNAHGPITNDRRSLDELLKLIRFVEHVSTKLHSLPTEDVIYRTVCGEFAQTKRYSASVAKVTEDGTALEVVASSRSPEVIQKAEQLTGISFSELKIDLARSPTYRQVVEVGKSVHAPVEEIIREVFPESAVAAIINAFKYEGKRSILVPIRIDNQVIAVIAISAPVLVEEFIPTVETLAHHISNAVYAAHERKLREQTERALFEEQRKLTTQARIINAILRSLDLKQRLAIILEEAMSLLRVETGAVYLTENDKMMLRSWRGMPAELREQLRSLPLGTAPLPPGMKAPLVVHERLSDRGNIPDGMKHAGIQAFASVPLTITTGSAPGKEYVGALLLASRRHSALNEADVRSLQGIGGQLALAIDHALQFDHAAQRLMRLQILREIDHAIISRLSIDAVIELVLNHVPPELGADAAAISLFAAGTAVVEGMRLPNGTIVQEQAFDLSESFIHWFVERQEPVIIYDLRQDPRVRLNQELIRTHRLVSYLGVPLVADGETIGILHITTVKPRQFAPEDVAFFQTLAGQAAIAIKSTRLFAEIEDAEKRYRGIFENAAEGIYQATMDGHLMLANPAMAQILGYETPDELITAVPNISQIYVDPARRAEFMDLLEREGTVTNFDTQVRRRDGTVAWISKSAHIVRDDHRVSVYYEGICEDITARVNIMQSLRETEHRLQTLIASVSGILWEADVATGRYTFVSRQAQRVLGYPVEQWLTNPTFWREHIHPDDRERVLTASAQAIAAKRNYELEYRMIAADGHIVWLQDIVTVMAVNDQPVQLRGVAVEITAKKQAEQQLEQYRAHLEELVAARTAELRLRIAALNASANAVIITDTAGTVVWANPAFTSLTGYSLEEVVGRNPRIFKSGKQDQAFYGELWRTIQAGDVWRGEIINRRKDGGLYHEEMTITPVRDDVGRITHFIAVKQDVTARRRMEDELRNAVRAANAANQAKSQFLANMSHELRTPLNAIIGFSQVLQEEYFGDLTEKQAEYVADILESGEHLLSLINDILDLSKIESGKLELEFSDVAVNQVLESSLTLIRQKARKHGITLTLNVAPEIEGVTITADERKLRQVLLNLLSNAAKFTPDGGKITVEANKQGEEIVISVSDTGIGIPAEEQARIFDEFHQVGQPADKPAGTGLGLAISKRIVEMHGGTIGVESAGIGKGSRFYFTIPMRPQGKRGELSPEAAAFFDRLEGMIDYARRYDRIFVVCQLQGISAALCTSKHMLKEVVKREARAYDFCGLDDQGNAYLVFPEIGRDQAQTVCRRITAKISELVPDVEPRCTAAEYPADGRTIADLLAYLRREAEF